MAKNLLVINIDIRETRVALIENGIIAELHIERHSSRGTLGNIYLGKVSRVLPGMQAAFIDIGEERAAFLHVEDLIRPDDFEAYLSGKGPARADEARTAPTEDDESEGEAAEAPATPSAAAADDAQPARPSRRRRGRRSRGRPEDERGAEASPPEGADDGAATVDAPEDLPLEELGDDDLLVSQREPDPAPVAASDEDDEPLEPNDDDVHEPDDELHASDDAARDSDEAHGAFDEGDDLPAVEVSSSGGSGESDSDSHGEPDRFSATEDQGDDAGWGDEADPAETQAEDAPTVALSPEEEAARTAPRARARRGGRGRRRRGSTTDRQPELARTEPRADAPKPAPAKADPARTDARSDRSRGGRDGRRNDSRGDGRGQKRGDGRDGRRAQQDRGSRAKDPLRVSKSTPIREVVREGQEVIVQVSKDPIGTKGARVTSHISLPGRYVVYLPTVEHVGISKRIGSDKERSRLREAIEAMKPPQGGLIVRTLAEGLTKKSLKADVGYLVRLWGEIAKKREQTPKAPACLYAELDLVLKTARDLFTDDIEKIVIDSKDEYQRLKRFVEMFMPERADAIELYEGEEPIFDEYGIEDEIGRALSRKVPLASGGHLIIDQAEALTAIDVNTGRFVGKGSRDLEETIVQTNLEAVEEIAYQLRFRNIGGLIILDLIDMERAQSREKVRRRLEHVLAHDKAKTTLNRISDLGLMEMTRKRTRESLGRQMHEPCFYCDGTGNLQSKQTVAYEILRQLKRDRLSLRGYSVVVNAHPAVIDLMKTEERAAVIEAERRYQRRIELVARKEYHLEQFDLVGK